MNKAEMDLRAPVYSVNLDKERLEIQRMVTLIRNEDYHSDTWCESTVDYAWYEVNPADSDENKRGSDITLYGPYNTTEIDLKGFQSSYDTVALTVERSDDDVTWRDALSNKKITDMFIFINELGDMYMLSMNKARKLAEDALAKKPNACKIVRVLPKTAGHYQKVMKIPLEELEHLADKVPPYEGRIITGETLDVFPLLH